MSENLDYINNINRRDPMGVSSKGKPYRVLVADDSTVMRKVVSQTLKSELFEICAEAENGQRALDLYMEYIPDFVFLDINMPVLDGLQALEKIIGYDDNAKIIMLTSEGQKETVLNAISKGAKGYIVKPPAREKVLSKLKGIIDKKEA